MAAKPDVKLSTVSWLNGYPSCPNFEIISPTKSTRLLEWRRASEAPCKMCIDMAQGYQRTDRGNFVLGQRFVISLNAGQPEILLHQQRVLLNHRLQRSFR